MLKKLFVTSIFSIFLANQTFADDIQIVGTIQTNKPTIKQSKLQSFAFDIKPNEQISLLKLQLSAKAKSTINKRVNHAVNEQQDLKNHPSFVTPKVTLDMNEVPVLNQGNHGSCVVFSITAAIDAIIHQGDYVSQLCQLSLGRYIESNGHTPSGWNGSWNRTVLGQMDSFGFVSKAEQQATGCGGLTEYPMCGSDLLNEESVADFHMHSEKLTDNRIAWSTILDVYQAGLDDINTDNVLLETKKSLLSGDRVVIGMILIDFDKGVVGAQGTYKEKNDTWMLTPSMLDSLKNNPETAGHAILVTGFDDNAIVTDENGYVQRGVVYLRNSWGENIGDKGDFYMTYSYFKALTVEALRIRHY